jgi:hypothetical protein
MSEKPEDKRRHILIVAIGTESVRVVCSAKEVLHSRYQLQDKSCRVNYLLIDTDTVSGGQDEESYEKTYQVQLADDQGKQRMRDYKKKVVAPQLEELQNDHMLPKYLTTALLEHALLERSESGEASKNPLKGYFYLLANLRRLDNLIEQIKKEMSAQNRSIYIMYSPISGTAAGSWFLITAMLFHKFEHSSPILINLMPSGLKGSEDHKNRNYAIFGWSTQLLNMLVQQGITLNWEIPQLEKPALSVVIQNREPLYVLLQSAYRNQGDAHLMTDEFFQVMAELLCLAIIGKQDGLGPSSGDSQITNTATDLLMDEINNPDQPTRRFTSRGYCAVRYNAELARKVTRMGVKDALLNYMLSSLWSFDFSPGQSAAQQIDPARNQKTQDEVGGELLAYVRRQVKTFYGEWKGRAYRSAYAERLPSADMDRTIDELCETFRQDMADMMTNLRGDGTNEIPIHQPIWQLLQNLLKQHEFKLFPYLSRILKSIYVDDAFLIEQLPELAANHPTIDDAIEAAGQNIYRYRTRVTISSKQGNAVGLELTFNKLLEEAYHKILLETLKTEYSTLLNGALDYFAIELLRFKQRLENIYEENSREYALHRGKLHQPIGAYLDERSYGLAKEKIEKYRQNIMSIIHKLFNKIDDKLDRHHMGQEQLNNKIDMVIMDEEGIAKFPSDVVGVIHEVASNQNLLTQLLSRGRALTKLQGTGYEKNWCIWHSKTLADDTALREALNSLTKSIESILSDESSKIIINTGALPLRSRDEIELVLSETILDFPLIDVETDKSMEDYWDHDDTSFNDGKSTSVHRVHTGLVTKLQSGRKRKDAQAQQSAKTRTEERSKAGDSGKGMNFVEESPEASLEQEIAIVASRLGVKPKI